MKRTPLGLLLRRLSCSLPSFALTTEEGHWLAASSSDPCEAGLLPQAIESARGFFPMTDGDLVLIQDPFAGGPGRDGVALVSAWKGSSCPTLFLATTVHCSSLRKLKLPPAPLRLGGEVNSGVLEALGPAREAVTVAQERLRHVADVLHRPPVQALLTKRFLHEAVDCEREFLTRVFDELPDGEADVETKTPSGETLRARLISEGNALAFDFSGTSAPKALQIPLAATSGIVWSAVRERLGLDCALDSFSPRHMPLTVPNGCFLNAKGGTCDQGLDEAVAWLQWTVEQLFQKWDRRKPRGLVNPFDLSAALSFGDDELSLRLPSGSAAREDVEGITFLRQREGRGASSLEAWERQWPLRVIRIDERVVSGKPRISGGRGLHLQLEVLKTARLRWAPRAPETRAKVERHQAPVEWPSVAIKRGDDEISVMAGEDVELLPGDLVTFLSGSGGGLV